MLDLDTLARDGRNRFGELVPATRDRLAGLCPVAPNEWGRALDANVGTWLAVIRELEKSRRGPVRNAYRRGPDKPEELTPDERELRALCFRLGRERMLACAERAGVEITPDLDGRDVAALLPELRAEAAELDAWEHTPPTPAERERARTWIRDIASMCNPKRGNP